MIRNIQLRVSLKEEAKLGLKSKTAKYLGVAEKDIEIKVQYLSPQHPNIWVLRRKILKSKFSVSL
jgi:hypothetical protein